MEGHIQLNLYVYIYISAHVVPQVNSIVLKIKKLPNKEEAAQIVHNHKHSTERKHSINAKCPGCGDSAHIPKKRKDCPVETKMEIHKQVINSHRQEGNMKWTAHLQEV